MSECISCGAPMTPGTDRLCDGCFASKLIGQEVAEAAKSSFDEAEAAAAGPENPDDPTEGALTETPVNLEAGATELNL